MRDLPLTILAIFAHPDDEIGVGSSLAHYGDAGVFTVLACASRGEAATIYCEDCATADTLADVRTHELECAVRNIGIGQLRWLGWPDGGMPSLPRERAVGQIVSLIREIRPDVLLTHPENGLYPHPDHLAVWEIVRAAYDAAADLSQYPQAGKPWATARLYTRALPQRYFDLAPEFAAARVELNGQLLPFMPTPDDAINVTMHVEAEAPRRLAAWDCHRSQHNPQGAFVFMPADLRKMQAENEYFVLVAARVPLPEGVDDDLLACLEDATGERQELTGEQNATEALRSNLGARRGYLAVYEAYLRQNAKPDFQALLRALADSEQEMIYLLAGALRRAGEPPAKVEPDGRALTQALTCLDLWSRWQFLHVSAVHAAALYSSRAAVATDDAEQGLWAELQKLAGEQLDAFKTLAV
jgi:LmbE family N-acetylglucosaminyl deacetylase